MAVRLSKLFTSVVDLRISAEGNYRQNVRGTSGGLVVYCNPQSFFINRLLNFLAMWIRKTN